MDSVLVDGLEGTGHGQSSDAATLEGNNIPGHLSRAQSEDNTPYEQHESSSSCHGAPEEDKIPRESFDYEILQRYRARHLYPVNISDRFADDRYEVWFKLGEGGEGTMWLCNDSWTNTLVALNFKSEGLREDITKARSLQSRLGDKFETAKIHDSFDITRMWKGKKLRYQCVVQEVVGPPFDLLLNNNYRVINPERMISMLADFARQLEPLQKENYAVGDGLSAGNVCLKLHDSFRYQTHEELIQLFGQPLMRSVGLTSTAFPRHLVEGIWWSEEGVQKWLLPKLTIIDIGDGFKHSFAAPELVFSRQVPTPESDAFAMALCILNFIQGSPVFETGNTCFYLVSLLELGVDIPEELVSKFKREHNCDGHSIEGCSIHLLDEAPLHESLETMLLEFNRDQDKFNQLLIEKRRKVLSRVLAEYHIPETAIDQNYAAWVSSLVPPPPNLPDQKLVELAHLSRGLLRFRPEDRLKPREVTEHPFFKDASTTEEKEWLVRLPRFPYILAEVSYDDYMSQTKPSLSARVVDIYSTHDKSRVRCNND